MQRCARLDEQQGFILIDVTIAALIMSIVLGGTIVLATQLQQAYSTRLDDAGIHQEAPLCVGLDRQRPAIGRQRLGDTDVEVGAEDALTVQGKLLAHEQVEIGGNSSLFGQIIAENAANDSHVVDYNRIHGNAILTYNGGLGGEFFSVSGWRDVR